MENSENIGKDIWRVAKEVLFNRPSSCATFPTSLQVEGRDVASNDIPDVFNENYTTIVDEMLTGRETPTKQDTDAYLRNLPQAPDELILYPKILYISEMKSKNNKTFDNLSTKLLKKCKAQLSPVIAAMVNKSFSEAQVLLVSKVFTASIFSNRRNFEMERHARKARNKIPTSLRDLSI